MNKQSSDVLRPGQRAGGLLAIALGLSLSMASLAQAQTNYTCSGVPKGVSMDANGHLVVQQIGGLTWARLCSVDGQLNGVAASACKATYAGLLAAQVSARPVTAWIINTAGSCAANTPWNWVAGYYFMTVDP